MAQPTPHDPDEFADKLKEWHQAIKSEFDAVDAEDSDVILSLVKKKFAASALNMADELVALAKHADSEAVQLNAIKYAYEFFFGKEASKDSGFNELLRELSGGKTAES